MTDFEKHRNESLQVGVDFDAALNDADSVDSVDSVKVVQKTSSGWADRSAQFGGPTGSISDTQVNLTLGAAATDEQPAGDYRVYVEITTVDGETLVETPTLRVEDTADTGAP